MYFMQPEDIIQQKEWQQLTDDERMLIAPLAAGEGEYNVLKKMLLIAQEDAADVPVLNSSMQQQMHQYLKQPAPKKRFTFWYAAAAAIVVIALSAIFLIDQDKQKETIAVDTTGTPRKDSPGSLKQQTITPDVLQTDSETDPIVQQEQKQPAPKTPKQIINSSDSHRDIAEVNTSVIENETLLSFVTEVY